jgi:hypothetical protein
MKILSALMATVFWHVSPGFLFSSALKMEVGDYPETLGPITKLQDVTFP